MNNNLIHITNGQITLQAEVEQKLQAFQLEKARMDILEKQIKEAVLKAMEENNIKAYESDSVKIIYKAPTVKKIIDTASLKEQGLYEAFLKESPVKASVVFTWK